MAYVIYFLGKNQRIFWTCFYEKLFILRSNYLIISQNNELKIGVAGDIIEIF